MAWLYVPGLEVLSEELNPSFLDLQPFAMSKGKPIVLRSWPLRWKRDHFLKRLFGLMCEPSMANLGVKKFLSSLEGSHVNLIQEQGNNWRIRIQEICGPTLPVSLARFDHTSYSWKMYQMSLSGHCPEFSKTFPKWGMMRRGVLWRLPKLEHHTKEHVGSYLPTPTASDGVRSNLTYGAGNLTLKGAVMKRKFATPTVMDSANMPMRKVAKESLEEGNWRGIDLKTSAQLIPKQNYPTPTAREPQVGGKLNPQWVEWLMGWPIGFTGFEHAETE